MLQIGDICIHFINDADTMVDPGGAFGLVPRALWSRYFTPSPEHLIPMMEMCLLVQVNGKNIVIDTGMGTKLGPKLEAQWHLSRPNGDLVAALKRLGIQPEDVDMVIDTHLHADHCGGNTRFDADGNIVPTFPNAEYVVQRREYEDASHPNERTRATYVAANFEPLVQSGQMRLLDGDTELAKGVWGIVTRGHTPGHMSIRFESGGQYAAFLCDLSTYAVHFERLGWMTAYDVEPLYTLETKRIWQRWALEHHAVVIFPHDPFRPAGYLQLDERGKPQLDPITVDFA
ncbi:MAG: MBL fold metallo-hydrolase [Chloroflexi bacterium]|nr:MAG: MBL fold metallo-hydrolase [Chloroflexota bacterium]